MPESKKIGLRDFTNCKFRSLLTNLPPGIQHMLDRALNSFGTDAAVLERWTGPVVVVGKDGSESTVAENRFFPHDLSIKDICCADGTAFCLYQTGVVDFGRNIDYFKARTMAGKSMGGCIHWAHYYYPHADNADVVYELPKIDTNTDPSTIDYRDWLPGDVFVYFDAKGDPEGDHVNIYLGPFIEVVDGVDLPKPVYHMFNSSIGITGGNEYCTAGSFEGHLNYCKSVGRTMVRTRVRAIEKLFRNMIGPPVVFTDTKPKKDEPPRAELAWGLAATSDSPYPIGRNLTWHDGIHLTKGADLKNADVETFAPGELILVRFGKKTRVGDSSMVLARHRFVTAQTRLLAPPPWKTGEQDDPAAGESKNLYSLYMQLAPLETYLDKGQIIEDGIPALYDGTVPTPDGKAVAPEWLRNLWLRRKPDLIDIIPDTAQLTLFALTRSGADAKPTLTALGASPGLTTRVWHPLKDLQAVTVAGTQYWLVPVMGPTNAEVWDMKIPPATVPARKKLTYYNPATGNTNDLPVGLAGSTELLHQEEDGRARLVRVMKEDGTAVTGDAGTLIRIGAHDSPGVILSYFRDVDGDKDQYDYDDASQTLLFKPAAKSIPLYTTTAGKDKQRTFVDETKIDIGKVAGSDRTFLASRDHTGQRTVLDRAFLRLDAGVWLTDAEIEKAEKLLDDKDTSLREAIKKRLKDGSSCLVGVKTNAKSGWEMKEGHLHGSDDAAAPDTVVIYRKIDGSGLYRKFQELPKDPAADQEQKVELQIPRPAADISIYPLLTPQGQVQSAVFELMFGAKDKGTNQAQVDAVVADNQKRKALVRKLMAGDLVDLRTADGVSQFQRNVGRDRLGIMGEIPAAMGADGTVPGLHFELFAGENLVDPGVPGNDGAIAPVPKTKWLVYKDSAPEGFFAPDFVKKLVDLLRKESDAHRIDLSDLATAFGEDDVVQPKEWMDFCKKNQRTIARLITVHKPEWKIDWAKEVKTAGTRGMHLSEPDKKALAEDSKELRWWKDDLSLEGISGDEVFFYHPLRFIEWLNTGLDFILSGMGGKKPKVKLEPLPAGEAVELSPDAKDATLFRFRTFVGESGPKTEAPFRVTLENVSTATPKFTVMIKRGEVHTVRLLQPSVDASQEYPHASVAPDFQVPVTLGGSGNGFFLADGNAHLADAGYSEATMVFKVNYNVRIPKDVEIKVEGHSSFVLGKWEVTGATAPGPVAGPRSLKLTLVDDAKVASAVEDSVVEGARIYALRVNVTTNTRDFDVSGKLIATFKGGDLGSDERKLELPLATRTIAHPAKGAPLRGEDVAKLQLYLSQIFALDGLPCYRDAGRGGEYQKDAKTLKADIKTAVIDGAYGKSLARALWRFVYAFGRTSEWKRPWPINTKKQNGSDGAPASQAEITGASTTVIEGLVPTKSPGPAGSPDELFAKRVGAFEKTYDYYPVVDSAFLSEILKRFKPPFVLPHVEVFFEETTIPTRPELVLDADWNKDGRIGKSTVLPISVDYFQLRIAWHGANVEKDGDLDVIIEVPAASGYTFRLGPGPSPRIEGKLRALLKEEKFLLYSNKTISSKPADNVLIVRTADGRKIGERQLHGSRDLLKAQPGDGCRDAAMLQSWLAQIPDKDKAGEFVYKNMRSVGKGKDAKTGMLVDGKWNGKCVEALKRFQTQYAATATAFPDLALAVRTKALGG